MVLLVSWDRIYRKSLNWFKAFEASSLFPIRNVSILWSNTSLLPLRGYYFRTLRWGLRCVHRYTTKLLSTSQHYYLLNLHRCRCPRSKTGRHCCYADSYSKCRHLKQRSIQPIIYIVLWINNNKLTDLFTNLFIYKKLM